MKFFLVAVISFLLGPLIQAQVLYNEDFETYTLGNLGTDPTGIIPGQGGWFTQIATKGTKNNNAFTIVNDPVKNKVLQLSLNAAKPDTITRATATIPVSHMIDNRAPGNNVIKFEIDYFTGTSYQTQHNTGQGFGLAHDDFGKAYSGLFGISIDGNTGAVRAYVHNGKQTPMVYLDSLNKTYPIVPFNTWITFIVYLDYNNKKAYFETPFFNSVVKADFLNQSTSADLLQDYKPLYFGASLMNYNVFGNQQISRKYDNIKITALNAVPPHVLSTESFLAEQFNIYPNPATHVVNITNNKNMLVQQVAVYNVAGKLISTQSFDEQAEIQLNVENLASGTYMLHLQTNEGIAVKKLVKK